MSLSRGSVLSREYFPSSDAWFYLNLWIPFSAEQSELFENNPRPGLVVLKAI